MKTLIAFTALLFGISANAMAYDAFKAARYDRPGYAFPNELSPEGLPAAIPCIVNDGYNGKRGIECRWLSMPRYLYWFDQTTQQQVRSWNKLTGNCTRGVCRAGGDQVGSYPSEVEVLEISVWYYVGESSDGRTVAYLTNTGPGFDGKKVSYSEAGQLMHQFWLNAGMSDADIAYEMDFRYQGGMKQFLSDTQSTSSSAQKASISGDIKEAWCNPRMDDDCSINGQKVPVAELGKYLPALDPSEVEASGGTCEYPICYDADYKPVGIRR
ncbi:hypothetical protein LJR071_001618 [Pseudomonas sp. LjRoot71]|uniref:hypothetical protein n=1 Tax=Pseudomonas sp. LjRoot71 TaxID=3342336 RepID=UPI003ED12579